MARELRISATIRLPEGDFDEAAALVGIRPVIEAFRAEIEKAGGEAECAVVVPKPRGAKADGEAA